MPYVHFKEKPLISNIITKTLEIKDSNIATKEALKSKEIEMGSQIRRQRLLLINISALLFKAFHLCCGKIHLVYYKTFHFFSKLEILRLYVRSFKRPFQNRNVIFICILLPTRKRVIYNSIRQDFDNIIKLLKMCNNRFKNSILTFKLNVIWYVMIVVYEM